MTEGSVEIREAFATGQFQRGRRLWSEYMGRLADAIQAGQGTEQMLADAGELLEWCRLGAKAFCARGIAEVNQAHVAQVYQGSTVSSARLFRTRL